jgi:transposase
MPVEIIADAAHLRQAIITRYEEGWSIRALGRHYGVGRNRIRRMVRDLQRQRTEGAPAPLRRSVRHRGSKLDVHMPRIKELLEHYPRITAVRMLEELRTCGYKGGITIVRMLLARLRPQAGRQPVIRFETDPGVQGQMDWSPYTIDFSKTGRTEAICFSYLLGFSRRHYIDFGANRNFYTLIRRHRDAFEHFGGVPRQCLYDSEKTVVLRWEAGQPIFNPAFIDFTTHYRCKPIACQRGRPQTKGKVERPFQYIEGNLLNGRTFTDIDDLRSCARWWLKEVSDLHIHDTTAMAPMDLFTNQEQHALQPLPLRPYDCSEVVFRVCPPDLLIEFERNLYSVPAGYIGEILAVKASEGELRIYSPYIDLLAEHRRHPRGAGVKEESAQHRQDMAQRYGLEPVREAFLRIGNAAEEFLKGVERKHPRNAGLHARIILQLKGAYNADDINAALAHALRYYAYDASAIERILKVRAIPRTLESHRNEKARQELGRKLPQIKQRPLNAYPTIITREDTDEPQQRHDSDENKKPLQDTQSHDDGTDSR